MIGQYVTSNPSSSHDQYGHIADPAFADVAGAKYVKHASSAESGRALALSNARKILMRE